MDSSLHSAHLTVDDTTLSLAPHHGETAGEEEHHIHLPNSSWWPFLLSAAILVSITGVMFLPDNPWLLVVAAPFVLIGILGWALEDPMASPEEHAVPSQAAGVATKLRLGQDVVDRDGNWLGLVQARFSHYILVDSGDLFAKAYYVPTRYIEDGAHKVALRLNVSEADMLIKGLDRVPEDLYEDTPEYGIPQVKGTPLFARGPLSPAETGHYNYGPNFPGINTDAAGSYRPEEVRPIPQKYVADRRSLYTTRKPIPPRVVSSN